MLALQDNPVRHDIIQCTKDNAAVSDAIITTVVGGWGELAPADIVVKAKGQLQANRVLGATDEAVAGVVRWFDHNGFHSSFKRKPYQRLGRQAQQSMKKRPVQMFPKRRFVHLRWNFVLDFLVQAG